MGVVDFNSGSSFARSLLTVVQPRIVELGWTTAAEDTTLFEYILLMLLNDKNESQVASELSNDLLDLGPDNPETRQFAEWLFETIESMKGGSDVAQRQAYDLKEEENVTRADDIQGDMEMDGISEQGQEQIPKGPKAMRNGSGSQNARSGRGGRILGQMNKSMNRDDAALHRVRGAGGGGVGRNRGDPPKGPRGQNVGRGLEAMANGRGMGNANVGMNGMTMGGMSVPPMAGNNNINNGMGGGMLNPQQQMALMQMYEQQAQMMQQIFSGGAPTNFGNSGFSQNNRGNQRKSFQRGDRLQRGGMHTSTKFKKDGQDETMADDAAAAAAADNGDSMEVESTRPDPATTICRWNIRCTNPDCPYVHQGPAAPPGITIDMKNLCSYGAACKNKKCAGKHPSPAQKSKFQAEQDCAYYPNCRDPMNCPYRHPTTPPCRNGADCTDEGCKFSHSKVACRFNPCTNPHCQFKHAEGQKAVMPKRNVWTAQKDGKEHVSERKYVDETQEEEVIIPGQAVGDASAGLDVAV